MTTLARSSHPQTAKRAGRIMQANKSGLAMLHLWAAECVKKTPGLTRKELGKEHSPDDPDRLGRRLDGAAKDGLIERGLSRKCSISGVTAQTWIPTDA